MDFWREVFRPVLSLKATSAAPILVPQWQSGRAALPNARYETFAREGYGANELIYACVEELSTSAAEPKMQARNGEAWTVRGLILDLLNRPNPFMDRFEFFATVIMHRSIAGNAYALKVRSRAMRTVELWLMRPDRVRIVPSSTSYIDRYEYQIGGGAVVPLSVDDVIHWKTRHPLDDFYGMPPLMAVTGRTDIDNFMKDFVKAFFVNAGVPAGLLNVEQSLDEDTKKEIKSRFRADYGGPTGWHDLMVIDNSKATFTPMTAQMGQRGLVIPELDEIAEARIPMVFGVPQSLIGTRTSYQNGGYANKRAEEQHFWTGTLAPLYKELAGPLNLRLVPDFQGVDEVAFDLSDVRALQPDEDAVATRWANLAQKGVASLQEAREKVGLSREPKAGDVFLVPSSSVPTESNLLDQPPPEPPPAPVASTNGVHA